MIVAFDTIAYNFKQRLAIVNPQRQFLSYMDAQQWPPKTLVFDAFYLLAVGARESPKQSIAVPIYDMLLQAVWVSKGTDINNFNNVLGANRGDRVRTSMMMKEEA